MSWIAASMAAVSIAGSVASSSASNKSNAKAFEANAEQVYKDYEYNIKQLQQQMNEANDNIALEMSANRWNGLKTSASTTNAIVEKNIAGNTAARAYNASTLNAMFAHNALAKKAEDTMASFGYQMKNTEIEANNALYGYAAQAKKSTISTLQAGTSAVAAGVQGYTMGRGISSFLGGGTTGMGSVAGGAGGFNSYEAAAAGGYTGGF